MCGIAGVVNYNGYNLEAMKDALRHRGPDDQGIYCDDRVALIHTRLAIQDIQGGKQPFTHNGQSIVFNGEIYNHMHLRAKLPEFSFQTNSDTETLLYLFQKFGTQMFDWIDGMFAFCIYDKVKQKLFFARDRAGKKPLYYLSENNRFFFASELNALKIIKQLDIDEEAIQSYLRCGFFFDIYTPYKHVHALQAGTFMEFDLSTFKFHTTRYFDILASYAKPVQIPLKRAVNELDNLLQRSVADRLLSSDIEVGVFLSGGIDSNLVAAIASRINPNLKTFTVKTSGAYDESALAARAARHYGTNHTELPLTMRLSEDIEKILTQYGMPFMDSSAVPSYYVAKEARKFVGVVLNGDGADELFGGYRRYVPAANKWLRAMTFIANIRPLLPKPQKKQKIYNYLYRLLAMMNKKNLDYYLSSTTDIYEDVLKIDSNPLLQQLDLKIAKIISDEQLSSLAKLLYLDFNLLLFSDLLVKMDIATMANSLEGRSPFLSKGMLDFAPGLPDTFKIKQFQTKYILRQLAKKYLPTELINQPKRGFEVPLKDWIKSDLKEQISDYLTTGCYSENYIKRDFIQNLLSNKISISSEKRAKIIWNLFCLEIWYKNENKKVRESL